MTEENALIVKASGAISCTHSGTATQRVAWNVLLKNAYFDLLREEVHRINLNDLVRETNYLHNDLSEFKQALKGLMSIVVEWNVIGRDENRWGATTLLAGCELINGIFEYSFSPQLKKKLSEPNLYAKISMAVQARLRKSSATVTLYENLLDWYDFKNNVSKAPWIEIVTFKKLLGIAEDAYSEYKDLKKRVITPAINDIEKNTQFDVYLKTKRKGRKISQLRFHIVLKPEFHLDPYQQKSLFEQPQSLGDEEREVENEELLSELIDNIGIDKETAVKLIKTVDEFEILEKIKYTLRQKELGHIKSSIAGYFLQAIKNNWNVADKVNGDIEKKRQDTEEQLAGKIKERDEKQLRLQEDKEIKKKIKALAKHEYNLLEIKAKQELKGKESLITYKVMLFQTMVEIYRKEALSLNV